MMLSGRDRRINRMELSGLFAHSLYKFRFYRRISNSNSRTTSTSTFSNLVDSGTGPTVVLSSENQLKTRKLLRKRHELSRRVSAVGPDLKLPGPVAKTLNSCLCWKWTTIPRTLLQGHRSIQPRGNCYCKLHRS